MKLNSVLLLVCATLVVDVVRAVDCNATLVAPLNLTFACTPTGVSVPDGSSCVLVNASTVCGDDERLTSESQRIEVVCRNGSFSPDHFAVPECECDPNIDPWSSPKCGTDGTTYPNRCDLKAARVDILHAGPCVTCNKTELTPPENTTLSCAKNSSALPGSVIDGDVCTLSGVSCNAGMVEISPPPEVRCFNGTFSNQFQLPCACDTSFLHPLPGPSSQLGCHGILGSLAHVPIGTVCSLNATCDDGTHLNSSSVVNVTCGDDGFNPGSFAFYCENDTNSHHDSHIPSPAPSSATHSSHSVFALCALTAALFLSSL